MLNYAAILKCTLIIFAVLLALQWIPSDIRTMGDVLPSYRHSPEYNRAAFVMLCMGVWGAFRLLNQRRR